MLRLLLSGFIALFTFNTSAQDYWEQIDQAEGLIGNNVTQFTAESPTKWWVATDFGIASIDNGLINNYPIPNLNPAVVYDLAFTNGRLWIATNNGLYSFDGNFQNYGTATGFKSLEINDLNVTSNGDLWIGTDSAVTMFNGQNFVRHDSIAAEYILVDGSDRVHAYRSDVLVNLPNFNYVFDANQWVDYGNTLDKIYNGTGFTNDNGTLYLIGSQDTNGVDGVYQIDYPNLPIFHQLEIENGFGRDYGNRLIKDGSQYFASTLDQLFTTTDSVLKLTDFPFGGQPQIQKFSQTANKIFICTDRGLIYSNKANKRAIKTDSLTTNRLRSNVYEFGPPFSSTFAGSASGFGFPKNNPTYTIYTADLMFVGRDSASLGFRSTDLFNLFNWNIGPVSQVNGSTKNYMVKIQKQEVLDHIANFNQTGYQMPASIRDWPAVGDSLLGISPDLAPFIDVNQNGCYDPQNGDYPYMKGDEALYWIRHHPDSTLLLEYHYMLYAYQNTQIPELNQAQFLQCRIVNRGNTTYDSAKVGFFYDGDLGNPSDDYVGCDSLSNIAYFYNGDSFDEAFQGQPGLGANSAAAGVKFLSDSMTNMVYFNIGGGPNGDPTTSFQVWNYMNSRWKNGQPMRFGGNGLNSAAVTNDPTTHMYTGDPLLPSGWTERTPGAGQTANSPGDRRLLASIGNFKFRPGESKVMDLVVGYGRKDSVGSHFENVPELLRVLNKVEDFWDTLSSKNFVYGSNYHCPSFVGLDDATLNDQQIKVYPNPVKGLLHIESDIALERLQLFSTSGALLRDVDVRGERLSVDMSNIDQGLYLLLIYDQEGKWSSHKLIVD